MENTSTVTEPKKHNAISLRLSPEIYDAVLKQSKKEKRSINLQIEYYLELQLIQLGIIQNGNQ